MADAKLTALTATTAPLSTDLSYIVTDPGGTPTSQKVTLANLAKAFGVVGKVTVTQPATSAVLTIADGKTLTASNTLTFTGTDGSTLAIGTGGTLGTAAYTATTAYEASGAVSTHAALTTGVHGLAITAGQTLTVTTGGTLGSAAYTASTAYEASGAVSTHSALTTGIHGLAITAGQTLTVTTGGTIGSAAYTASTAYEASGAIASHAALTTGVHGLAITAGQTLTVTTGGTLGTGAYATIADYAAIAGATFTGAVSVQHSTGVIIGKDETGGTPNVAGVIKMFSAGDNAFYNTFTAGTNTANATYTLPTAMPAVSGYALVSTDAGVMSWAAAGGFAWGASVTDTSGTGLTLAATSTGLALATSGAAGNIEALTINNSSAASTIGKSIVIGNTQSSGTTGMVIDVGTSSVGNTGITLKKIKYVGIDIQGDTTANAFQEQLIKMSVTHNTNGGNLYSTGLFIANYETGLTPASYYGGGIFVNQRGAGGTSIAVYAENNINSSTNGLVNYTISNTQSGASVMQKIDLGTSAQGHTGLLVQMVNASTSARGFLGNDSSSATTGVMFEARRGSAAHNGTAFAVIGDTTNRNTWAKMLQLDGNWNGNTGDNTAQIITSTILANLGDNARTTDPYNFAFTQTLATAATRTHNFNMFYVKRTNISNNASANHSAQGSVLKLENVATQTAGTLTDTVTVLDIVQDVDSTGVPLNITQNAVVSTNFKKLATLGGITLWMSDGTTAEGALSGTEGDICFNGGTGAGQAAFCDATGTNWTDM